MHIFLILRYPHRIAALLLALLVLISLTVPVQAIPPTQSVTGGTVNWDNTAQVITANERHNYPWVAVDSNDKTHVVYIASNPGTTSGPPWQIRYINNVNGTFNYPGTLIAKLSSTPAIPSTILHVGPNNVLHLTYVENGTSDNVYYQRSTDSGASWSERETVASGPKSAAPDMAIDSEGNAHITWIQQCSNLTYNVMYRMRSANGGFSPTSKPKDDCNTFQNRPAITFAAGKPQIIFQNGSSSGAEIYHARLEGSQWIWQNITNTPFASQNPTLASDGGNNLFMAWDENFNSNNHEIVFKASFDGGVTWSAENRLTNNPGISTYPYIAWSSATQRAFITWHDQGAAVGLAEEIWVREFNPVDRSTSQAYLISNNPGRSTQPKIAFGSTRAQVVWQDNQTAPYQIYLLGGALLGTTGCSGTLSLAGGATSTRETTISATITPNCPDGGTPTTMQISVGAPPSSTTQPAQIAYNANPTITLLDNVCDQTVYVRLFKNGTAGNVFNSKISVDGSVNADIMAVNPYMKGLPAVYTSITSPRSPVIAPTDVYEGGASDGAPNYTRVRKFFLGITDANDCSGLATFMVPGSDTLQPVAIPESGFYGAPALPGVSTAGEKNFTVIVSDTVGNQLSVPVSLIYDPERPNYMSGTVTGDSNNSSVMRTLNFSNVSVNDTTYGANENLPAGQQFWGVWIANVHLGSTTNITPDNPKLYWQPVPIETPSSQFSVNWSLLTGFDSDWKGDKSGQYQILVRFLDGAGNPTQSVISTTVTLDSGYTIPTTYLPLIGKSN